MDASADARPHCLIFYGGGQGTKPRRSFGFELIARSMLGKYRVRSAVALALMIAQAFLFNAVFFSYGLVLSRFYGVSETRTGTHLLLLAISNFWVLCYLVPFSILSVGA